MQTFIGSVVWYKILNCKLLTWSEKETFNEHFHDWIDYNGVAFSIGANRVTRMGSHICGISGVSKFRQVGIWGIFAQK